MESVEPEVQVRPILSILPVSPAHGHAVLDGPLAQGTYAAGYANLFLRGYAGDTHFEQRPLKHRFDCDCTAD